jgi:hypothetical protein
VTRFGGAVSYDAAGQPTWHRICESGACPEVATRGDAIMLRSSLSPEAIVTLTRDEWRGFLADVKDGRFDHM